MTALRRTGSAPPVRQVHLGLGSFFRAHQAWYADRLEDEWGIAAFTGRSAELADVLRLQDGLYSLVTRGPDRDSHAVIRSLVDVRAAAEHHAWLDVVATPGVSLLTSTVTEAGYRRASDGGLDRGDAAVLADVVALRTDLRAPVATAPARLVAGFAARRLADAGPITLVPCDNLPSNAQAVSRVVAELADLVDPTLVEWIGTSVSYVSSVVDRITPRTTPEDVRALASAGVQDSAPVITEPFSEWVLAGRLPSLHRHWEDVGVRFADEIATFEHRKLWLLNGGHSLLAYVGSLRGATTVAEAVADDATRSLLELWWSEASRQLALPDVEVADYRAALTGRFANRRIHHRLDQIAADGSQKLPVRILPTLRAERAAGRLPEGAVAALAGWLCHLRGHGVRADDPHLAELRSLASGAIAAAAPRVLSWLDPALGADDALVDAVVTLADRLVLEAPR